MENHLKKRIGFFGGTFDPIHFGHLNLAIEMQEKHHLNEVFFCPANCSPEKHHLPPMVEGKHRQIMTALGIEDIPGFSLITYELERSFPSYTIDTIRMLKKEHPDAEFYLILGEDILVSFSKWKEVEELVKLAHPLVGTRPGSKISFLPEVLQVKIKPGMTTINVMEISSTMLRLRLNKRLYCGHLVLTKVLDYIYEHNLYL